MAKRTLPGLGLTGFWGTGASGWGDENDENLRRVSALAQLVVESRTAALPTSPADGVIHIVPSGGNANQIAVRDEGQWVYIVPQNGWRAYDKAAAQEIVYTGSGWQVMGEDTAFGVSFSSIGTPAADSYMWTFISPGVFSLPSGLSTSRGYAATPPTAATSFSIRKNGSVAGTMTFEASANVATFAMASATGFVAGDRLQLLAPADLNGIADIAATLIGQAG